MAFAALLVRVLRETTVPAPRFVYGMAAGGAEQQAAQPVHAAAKAKIDQI
jgi:hypothetical protein